MPRHNPQNERIKRSYFIYLREARRLGETSVDGVAKALSRFEEANGFRDFKRFHREQDVAFKRKLDAQRNARTGERLSRATVHSTLLALRSFFVWLADQPGYKRKIRYSDADYFNLSERDVRIAKAPREKPVPELEQIHQVLAGMAHRTDVNRRNGALIALTILTGARDGALASLKLRHIDIGRRLPFQDAREVNTKFGKTIPTWFFPVGGDTREIVETWVSYLRTELLWGTETRSSLPPALPWDWTEVSWADGLNRRHWNSAQAIRRVFREAFANAGLPYFNPHSFRNTLARLGQRVCRNAEELKAWSQNLGHQDMLTTLKSYGGVPSHRQGEIILGMENRQGPVIGGVFRF